MLYRKKRNDIYNIKLTKYLYQRIYPINTDLETIYINNRADLKQISFRFVLFVYA